jgi:redox-sensitive bicupin YhaK (pirin superfamily)
MIRIRPAGERFVSKAGWLDSRHTFSFNNHWDPEYENFRALRVINDDKVAPNSGFPMHPHRDMEIITWVLDGELEHADSTGAKAVLRPGMIQRMSAGTGIYHSERNSSPDKPVHLLQIWIQPAERGIEPRFEDRTFAPEEYESKLRLVASPGGRDDSSPIAQDAEVYIAKLFPGDQVAHELKPERHAWVQVARGEITMNGQKLQEGDGAAVSKEAILKIEAEEQTDLILFDLA